MQPTMHVCVSVCSHPSSQTYYHSSPHQIQYFPMVSESVRSQEATDEKSPTVFFLSISCHHHPFYAKCRDVCAPIPL